MLSLFHCIHKQTARPGFIDAVKCSYQTLTLQLLMACTSAMPIRK